MFVRRLAIASLILLAVLWAAPVALAQAATGKPAAADTSSAAGTSASTADAGKAEPATPETMESVEEKPAAKIPKRAAPKAEAPEVTESAPVDMSVLVPQDEVQVRRQAALVTERKAQEEIELAKPSVKRTKVVRLDNQPKQKTRPVAVIKGTLGPYGYGQRYREGTAGQQRNRQNQNPASANQANRPGQLGAPGSLPLGGGRGNRRR